MSMTELRVWLQLMASASPTDPALRIVPNCERYNPRSDAWNQSFASCSVTVTVRGVSVPGLLTWRVISFTDGRCCNCQNANGQPPLSTAISLGFASFPKATSAGSVIITIESPG